MNRREVIAALVAMPGLTRIAKADVGPNDVIVAEFDREISHREIENVCTQLSLVWPGQRIVICDNGMRLKVLQK